MAIYTTNNTPYKGRSLQDMLVPYLMYTQRYDDIANKIGELGDLSVIWNNLLSPTRDHETYRTVSEYNERLGNTIADMQNGNINLNDAMNKLQNMRREYNSWGTAVDAAYKQRQKLIEELRALANKEGGYHFTIPAESISIDKLIENPAYSYETLSEGELYTRGMLAAASASSRKYSTYQITRFENEYENLINLQGYTQRDAAKFLADKYNIPELGKIFDNISKEYNLNRFGNEQSIDRIQLDLAIFNGILDGMTGKRSELNLGRRKEPTLSTFDTGVGKGKSPYVSFDDLHIVEQGSGKPTAEVNTSEAFIDPNTGALVDSKLLSNKLQLKEIEDKLKEYEIAIQNGTFELSGNVRQKSTNIRDYLDENGKLSGLPWQISAFGYKGKSYDIKEYNKLKDKEAELLKPATDLYDELNKYSYIAYHPMFNGKFSEADAVNIGRQFDNMTSQPVITSYSPDFKPSDMQNIINHYQGVLTGPTFSPTIKDSLNGIFILNNDGTLSERNSDLSETKPTDMVIFNDYGSKSEIGFRKGNTNYALRGDRDIDNMTRNYDLVKQWMLDFTNNVVNDSDNSIIIFNSNIETINQAANGHIGKLIGNTPFYGYVLYDQATGDVIKMASFNRNGTGQFLLPEQNSYMTNYGSIPVVEHSFNAQRNGDMNFLHSGLKNIISSEFNNLKFE